MHVMCLQTFPIDYCVDFVNAAATKSRVTFVCSASDLPRVEMDLDPGIRVVPLDWPRHRSIGNVLLIRRIAGEVRAAKPDVVHFLGDGTIWLNLLVPIIRHVPRVVTVHDVYFHPGDTQSKRVPRLAMESLRRSASTLIVHGENQRQAAIELLDRDPDHVRVVPHVVLHRYRRVADRLKLQRRPSARPTVLFFGRLMTYKGLQQLVDAARLLRNDLPDVHFVIAGTGPDAPRLRGWIEGDATFTLLERYVDDDETAQLFLDCDLVILPYIEASQSGVLALAAALGRPVVVTDVGDLGSVVQDNGMGLVVPPGDVPALADAVRRILVEPALADEVARGSERAALDGIGYRRVGQDVARIYKDVLDRHQLTMAA